jgi:hypothetical protein
MATFCGVKGTSWLACEQEMVICVLALLSHLEKISWAVTLLLSLLGWLGGVQDSHRAVVVSVGW